MVLRSKREGKQLQCHVLACRRAQDGRRQQVESAYLEPTRRQPLLGNEVTRIVALYMREQTTAVPVAAVRKPLALLLRRDQTRSHARRLLLPRGSRIEILEALADGLGALRVRIVHQIPYAATTLAFHASELAVTRAVDRRSILRGWTRSESQCHCNAAVGVDDGDRVVDDKCSEAGTPVLSNRISACPPSDGGNVVTQAVVDEPALGIGLLRREPERGRGAGPAGRPRRIDCRRERRLGARMRSCGPSRHRQPLPPAGPARPLHPGTPRQPAAGPGFVVITTSRRRSMK